MKNLNEERMLAVREALSSGYPTADVDRPALPLRRLGGAFFRAMPIVVTLLAVGGGAGVFLAVSSPNQYVSRGKFVLTGSGSETIRIEPFRTSDGPPASSSDPITAAASEVLLSNTVLERVAERVTPQVILAPYRPEAVSSAGLSSILHRWQIEWSTVQQSDITMDNALRVLHDNLAVDKEPYGSVLTVSYLANDRQRAQLVLAAYMEEALRWHQQLWDDPKVHEQIANRAAAAEEDRAVAARNLETFLDQTIKTQTSFPFELGRARSQEAEAEQALRAAELERENAAAQLEAVREKLKAVPELVTVRRPPSAQEQMAMIDDEIGRARLERASSTRSDTAELDRKIERLEAEKVKILETAAKAPRVEVQEVNPAWLDTKKTLTALENSLVQLDAKLPQLREVYEKAEKRLRELADVEPKHDQLREDLQRAEDRLKHANDALLLSQQKRELHHLGNYSLLKRIEDASLPLEKEGPNRVKLILGGLLVGLLGALGLVLLLSLPDTVVREREDLEGIDGATLLGVMPKLDRRNLRRHQTLRVHGW